MEVIERELQVRVEAPQPTRGPHRPARRSREERRHGHHQQASGATVRACNGVNGKKKARGAQSLVEWHPDASVEECPPRFPSHSRAHTHTHATTPAKRSEWGGRVMTTSTCGSHGALAR